MAKARVRESDAQIYAELERAIQRDAEMQADMKEFAGDVRDHWRAISPVETGRYASSIRIRRQRDVRGFPSYWVGTNVPYANIIEFGSGPPGPTEEFAPAARTAHFYHGSAP